MLPNYDQWKLHDGIGIEKSVGVCEQCGTQFYEGDSVVEFDNENFCDLDCMAERVGVKEVVL